MAGSHTLQAIYGDQKLKRSANTTKNSQIVSKARWFAIFVRVANISSSPKKPMPISINNSLPSVCIHLGIPEDDEHRMQMLVNTGAAMNTGDLKYHLWKISQCPDIVEEFLQCGKDTDYDVVHLLAALNLSGVPTNDDHGQIIAVIRYRTPYIVNGKGPFILSFALGNDVSLRCVLGVHTLLAVGASIGLASGLLSCTELNRKSPLDLHPPGKELLEGATLYHYTNTIPHSVSTNFLQHTSAYGDCHTTCHSTPSDHIHVTDNLFKNEVLQALVYVPPDATNISS